MPQPSRIINSAFLLIFYIYLELSNFIYQPTKTMPNFPKRNSLPRHLCFPRVSPNCGTKIAKGEHRDKRKSHFRRKTKSRNKFTWLYREEYYIQFISTIFSTSAPKTKIPEGCFTPPEDFSYRAFTALRFYTSCSGYGTSTHLVWEPTCRKS